ncbi:hypothetical protein Taro_028730 [Colocasia esculenta]|uniref:Uncharacterized protein n=1 Tax=Colocasia esculenta TaxID=4460 RepID=A0A843VY52_COLES|nr:hypothetical protein [Colocasia esculenta]
MEGYKGGLKGYWKRKRYQRLDGGGGARSRGWRWRSQRPRVQLSAAGDQGEGAGGRRRRFWRIKIAPKLRFLRRAVAAPRQLLTAVRDAYVRMMLRFANSRVFSAGGGLGYFGGDPAPLGFGPPALKEYDEKMIVEIYKSLMAQGHLVAAGGGGQGTQLVPRR